MLKKIESPTNESFVLYCMDLFKDPSYKGGAEEGNKWQQPLRPDCHYRHPSNHNNRSVIGLLMFGRISEDHWFWDSPENIRGLIEPFFPSFCKEFRNAIQSMGLDVNVLIRLQRINDSVYGNTSIPDVDWDRQIDFARQCDNAAMAA